jgi:flagellar export protein FliJ
MAAKRVLTQLLRLREIEEEQSRRELEVAIGNQNEMEQELEVARRRQSQGRGRFGSGIADQDAAGRTGGAIEMELASRQHARIQPRLHAAEAEVLRQREEFLLRRMGRRQVETLIENAQAERESEIGRRAQQILDDWYGRSGRKDDIARPDRTPSGDSADIISSPETSTA